MIQATIRMKVPSQNFAEVLEIFKPVVDQCEVDLGCLSCHIYRDLRDKQFILLMQVWSTEEDLERHLRTSQYHNLLLALELALKRPEIRFDTISNSTGVETIERARNQPR